MSPAVVELLSNEAVARILVASLSTPFLLEDLDTRVEGTRELGGPDSLVRCSKRVS